ncbi:MAG: hypothetical protein L6264_11185 [Weeksellaceae bacterium]|nr:hypothetical protein [Bacteroidota bacterium]MCG2781500.1 hypothetical protein [Weeksellaceae bacterium]
MKNTIFVLLLVAVSCKKEVSKDSETMSENIPTINRQDSATGKLSNREILKSLNDEIIQTLKTKNYTKFSTFIHPEKGIRFSMYAFIRPEKDKHFNTEDFMTYIGKPTKFTWGEKDGSGNLLIISLGDYLETWAFKRDFSSSEFSLNEFKGKGNSINNLEKIYPEAIFTENYIPGSEKYSGMDWNALRFVFEKYQGKYYLIAVVNDQWTI